MVLVYRAVFKGFDDIGCCFSYAQQAQSLVIEGKAGELGEQAGDWTFPVSYQLIYWFHEQVFIVATQQCFRENLIAEMVAAFPGSYLVNRAAAELF